MKARYCVLSTLSLVGLSVNQQFTDAAEIDAAEIDAAEIDAAEIDAGELQPALNLFITTSEQLNIEKELRELKAGKTGIDKPQAMSIKDASSGELVKDEITADEQGIYPNRYDGAVLKGKQVLGVWFDGSRHSPNPTSSEFRIDTIDQSGRARVFSGNDSFELYPGDELSLKIRSSVSLQSEVNAENTVGVVSK